MKKYAEEFGPLLHLNSMNRLVEILKNISDPSVDNYLKQIATVEDRKSVV